MKESEEEIERKKQKIGRSVKTENPIGILFERKRRIVFVLTNQAIHEKCVERKLKV